MAELEDAWLQGRQLEAKDCPLDPEHDAMVYAGMVLLGMHGLILLGRLHLNQSADSREVVEG